MKISTSLILTFVVMFLSSLVIEIFILSDLDTLRSHCTNEMPNLESIQNSSHLNSLAQFIRYYDEVLTQSARNYAFTGKIIWKERYKENEPLLDSSIKEAISIGDEIDRNYFFSIDSANSALVKMEYQSIELVDNGRTDEAIKLLESEEYWSLKRYYQQGLIDFAEEKGRLYNQTLDVSILNMLESKQSFNQSVKNTTVLIVTYLAINLLMLLLIIVLISRFISKPLKILGDTAVKIGKGDFNAKINIKTGDEIESLADSINLMSSQLKKYQERFVKIKKEEEKVMETEITQKTKELKAKMEEAEKAKEAILNMMEDLREANENLKEVDKTKTNFLNMVSHELKTPLTAIFAHLDVIDDMKSNLSEQELKSLDAVKRNSDQLKTLIDNLLEISRIEAGKFELNISQVNIVEVAKAVIKNVKILAEKKGLAIKKEIEKAPVINADEMRVREVITNLLGNAIKFTEKGSITIKVKKLKDFIVVSIIDTGIGIPPNKIKNLFQKFYQVDSSPERKYGGTGLGLSISKQIVNAHGGEISAESILGKGAAFTFTLPIKQQKDKRRLK